MEQNIKTDFEKLLYKSTFSNNEKDTKRESLNNFLEKGFPNRKLEDWKFSDISRVIQKNIGELSFYNDQDVKNQVDETIFIKNIEHNKIVVVNGKIEKLSFEHEESDKIEVITLSLIHI